MCLFGEILPEAGSGISRACELSTIIFYPASQKTPGLPGDVRQRSRRDLANHWWRKCENRFGGMSLDGKPSKNIGRDNPDEYDEIVEENFAISYPEKFQRNFRDYSP